MTTLRIMFSRYSAFYSPLIATKAGGFLEAEGLDATFAVAGPGDAPARKLAAGELDLIQSAVSASWTPLEKGQSLELAHFVQINQRDGFFVVGRHPDSAFRWAELAGRDVLVDHGGQPLAMFRYALHKQGVDSDSLNAIDAGAPDAMEAAFRGGQGDFIQLQGPAPQQIERDGAGHVLAAVGDAIGPVAFSSLCATKSWLASDEAAAFTRAYARARAWVRNAPAADVAKAEAPHFTGIDQDVLATTIAAYQRLGTWDGGVEIAPEAYERALDVFEYNGRITQRWPYAQVVAPPPAH